MADLALWEILVPRIKNNGSPYRTRHHRAWDEQVLKITGGLTVMHPTTTGLWTSHPVEEPPPTGLYYGKEVWPIYRDSMIPVRIACTSEQMDEIIRRTLVHYPDQEAVMAYKVSDEVRIVHRET